MTRTRTALVLTIGIIAGYASSQLLPSALATPAASTAVVASGGVIRFIIDGKEQGRIDASGLHIKGDVQYSGVTVDTAKYDAAPEMTAAESAP